MCDGSLMRRTLAYDVDKAKPQQKTWTTFEVDDDGMPTAVLGREVVDTLSVPYRITGTAFNGFLTVEEYNPDAWPDDLEYIRQRQDTLTLAGAENEKQLRIDALGEARAEPEIDETEDEIFATTALGAYLAANMIAGNTAIDLTPFPEQCQQLKAKDAT